MNTIITRWATTALTAATAAIVLSASTAFAEVDFAGKTVTIVVPFREGGGGDVTARLFQPFLQKHLPGSPKVIVFNRPGGGATKGSNYFESKAEPDGMTAVIISTSTLVSQGFGGKKAKYDVRKWRPVFTVPQDTVFYALPETGVKGKDLAEDVLALRKHGVRYGAKNVTSAELRGLFSFQLLGIEDVKTTLGLESGPQRAAMMRGELNVNYDSASSFNSKVKKHAKKGTVVPFMTLGIPQPDGSVIRGPVFPDLPTVIEGYRKLNNGKEPSGPVYEAWKNLATMGVSASKGIALPTGTPDDVHEAWTIAVKNILKDEEFIEKGRKVMGNYPYSFGKDAKAIYNNAVDIKPETRAWMKGWIFKQFAVKM
jgi:tripartite-type tricarboxylate transporter receptor subunit TctC